MDPLVLSVVVVTLSIVALLACAIPARRAARIDPLVALADQ
jgi:putative ABC transport system permease protein